ncbi:hypothetical protein [Fluviicola chungangensis]|uniref:YcxB family protein n=1 Tax=Fluviicola chungangensis TaxID=2597671 RepID=A0A556MYZ8_9FLAO|nr:hypothetical protein [Fluviicola chungangensis]TSJ45019.1 hypothetical protein FO442_10510 [Fluviicola chungangensis]
MDILIKNQAASQSITEQIQIRTKLYIRKTRNLLLIGFGIALLLIVSEIFSFNSYSMIRMGKNQVYSNFHLMGGLGMGLAIVFGYLAIRVSKLKKHVLSEGKSMADQFHSKNEFEIHINEQEVVFSSHILFQKINWSLFKSYTLYENYLFLNFENQPLHGISIDKRLLSDAEFQAIRRIATHRLKKV